MPRTGTNPGPRVVLPKTTQRTKRKAIAPSPSPPPPPQTSSQTKKKPRTHKHKPDRPYNKTEVFEILAEILEKSQDLSRSRKDFDSLLFQFEEHYYTYNGVNKSLDTLRSHHKYCAGVLWRMLLPVFAQDKGKHSDAVVRFFTRIALDIGVEAQLVERNIPPEEVFPLFMHVLKCILQCHCDQRLQVRVRIMELLLQILSKFHIVTVFVDHPTLRQDILSSVLKHRVRDRASAVRVQSVLCLAFFLDDAYVRKSLMLSTNSDPNDEVRKAAVKVLRTKVSTHASIFTEKIFDGAETVRAEAFSALSSVSLSKIKSKSQRENILNWGLTQTSVRVKKIVVEKLLPAWLEGCNKSIINLFMKLDLTTKPKTAHLILDSLYPEPTPEVFETIDISFLTAQKIISFEEYTAEATLLWLALCTKFKDSRECLTKLLPEAIDMCDYIETIVKAIHSEYEEAKLEGRMEEYTKVLGLAHILRLVEFLLFEESSRMENILKYILMDPVLDDAIIVTTAVDVTAWLMDPENERFDLLMSGIIREMFDGEPTEMDEEKDTDQLKDFSNSLRINENEFPLSQESNGADSSCTVSPGISSAKGLVVVTRYLTLLRRVSPIVRYLCNCRIIQFLEDEDGRVRGYTLAFYATVGITERADARQSFVILMLAIKEDIHPFVQEWGFKSIVDLLLHYKLESFRQTEEIDEPCPMPEPFDNPTATDEEMQAKVISVLEGFGGRTPSNRDLLRRVQGLIKLLIRGRITCTTVITNLLSLWANPVLFGSSVFFLIGNFVPMYSMLSLTNAERMTTSLISCLKRDIGNLDDTADDGRSENRSKTKVIELVVSNTSERALKRFVNPHSVHEKFALKLLSVILEDLSLKENAGFAQVIKFLDIADRAAAVEIKKICNYIYDILVSGEVKNDQLKLAIKGIGRTLYKRFGDLDVEEEDEDTVMETSDCKFPDSKVEVEEEEENQEMDDQLDNQN